VANTIWMPANLTPSQINTAKGGKLAKKIGGKLINLNDLVDPSLTLLTNANGISDNGKIVASGLNGHVYVLTPK